ncbi:MAG: PEP-CTERM sorting domain-containing protein [Luteolibacter sp.]
MKNNTLLSVLVVAFSFSALEANAQSINAQLDSVSPSLLVKGTFNSGGNNRTYVSGVNNFTNTDTNEDFTAFCVEPTQFITIGQSLTYEVSSTSFLNNSDLIAKVIGGFLVSSMDSEQAAAAQWAIWELVTETSGSLNLNDGLVSINSVNQATATLANQYLSGLDSFQAADITFLSSRKYQDMVTWKAIPEPSSFGLLLLSSALLLRRKRK